MLRERVQLQGAHRKEAAEPPSDTTQPQLRPHLRNVGSPGRIPQRRTARLRDWEGACSERNVLQSAPRAAQGRAGLRVTERLQYQQGTREVSHFNEGACWGQMEGRQNEGCA